MPLKFDLVLFLSIWHTDDKDDFPTCYCLSPVISTIILVSLIRRITSGKNLIRMLLATGPSLEFVKLIQILCWILLPLGAAAMLVTIILHYLHKRKASRLAAISEEEFLKASPELLGYTNGDGEYIFFDQSTALAEYKRKLLYYHARYNALRHDYDKLELKYDALGSYATAKFMNPTISEDIEVAYRQIPKALQEEIAGVCAQHKTEKEELLKESQQALNSSSEFIDSLKNELAELKRQNELLQTTAEDYKNLSHSLQNQLSEAETTKKQLVEKVETNKHLLQQLNNEINATLDSESPQSPVIALRPEYVTSDGAAIRGV